jgi:hypothetical protein
MEKDFVVELALFASTTPNLTPVATGRTRDF